MSNGAICPECGGVIGGDPKGSRPACQCSANLTMDDTQVEAQPVVAAPQQATATVAAPPPPGAKICIMCGKDVTHAKRAKDARGYWCYECHRADLRRERAANPRTRCPQCGRLVPAESITTYHGETMCAKCRVEEDELPNHLKAKFKNRPQEDKEEVIKKEKKRIYILAAVFGVLVVIILLRLLNIL